MNNLYVRTQVGRMVKWATADITSVPLLLIIISFLSRSTFTLISQRLLLFILFINRRIIYWVIINGLEFHWNKENKLNHWQQWTHVSKMLTDLSAVSAMSSLFLLFSVCLGSLSSVISSLDECIGISFSIMTSGSIFTIAFPSSALLSLRSGWELS